MTASVAFIQVGDLHADAADGWLGLAALRSALDGIAAHRVAADFLFLPGDNANGGRFAEYAALAAVLADCPLPWRVVPGDHDFAPGDLDAYHGAVPHAHRPDAELVAGHRCIFLDMVSAGRGGPDFRLDQGERFRLADELARAAGEGQVPLVFMHAYPADLAADAAEVAQTLADGGAAFVATGHTHHNELLNDGRVVYGAVRSSAQIEEDGGRAGLATVCVHDRVPSWRFRPLEAPWPAVQVVAPCDLRLVTRPADPRQVPRPGPVEVVARGFGAIQAPVLAAPGGVAVPMARGGDGLWRATVGLAAGLHPLTVRAGPAEDMVEDVVEVLVRPADDLPKRRPPVALGHPAHAVGAWPAAGLLGTRLGPNANGGRW